MHKIFLLILKIFDFFYQRKILKFLKLRLVSIDFFFDIGAHRGETIKIYLKNFKNLPVALEPLVYGINIDEREKLIKLLSNYIDLAFSNNDLQNLYFVVQPTIKHVEKIYVMDNRNILFSAIKNHKFKDKIKVISFFDKEKSFYSFREGDIFSHPTNDYYLNKFWPKIFSEVLSEELK